MLSLLNSLKNQFFKYKKIKPVFLKAMLIILDLGLITLPAALAQDPFANPSKGKPVKDTSCIGGCPARLLNPQTGENEETFIIDKYAGDTHAISTQPECSKRQSLTAAPMPEASLRDVFPGQPPPMQMSPAQAPSEFFSEKGDRQILGTRVSGTSVFGARVLIFVSFSMPESSLKSLGEEAERYPENACRPVLVMRGLYQDSFAKTAEKLKDLKVPVEINPDLFEAHQVTAVPTFVAVKDGKALHSLKGNVTLAFAIKTFAEREGGTP